MMTDKEKISIARNKINSLPMNELIHDDYLERIVFQHPDADKKIGPGILGFKIKQNRLNKKAKEMWIVRLDNSEVDCSFISCATGKAKNKIHNLFSAMRNSVRPQIDEFRKKNKAICEICTADANHVDHIYTFESLVATFMEVHNGKAPDLFDDCPETNMAKFKQEDMDFEKKWVSYHKQQATLRMLCSGCNLGRSRRNDGIIATVPM